MKKVTFFLEDVDPEQIDIMFMKLLSAGLELRTSEYSYLENAVFGGF